MKEASYYSAVNERQIQCNLCPHECRISNDRFGICRVRKNSENRLYSEIYGRISAISMDPVEKKPLYHFFPSREILSIGTWGCNLKCPFCQNWNISQQIDISGEYLTPETIVKQALKYDSIGIAYTYSEPGIWAEYVIDTGKIARKSGVKNVLVTNGFISEQPLNDILAVADAMNVDLKTYNSEVYSKVLKGDLDIIKRNIEKIYDSGCHLEITTLIVTGLNDNLEEMNEIIDFIASIDKNIPWHISRYHPSYNYDKEATDIDFLLKVYSLACEKLNFVYTGNIPSGFGGGDTICPECENVVISRNGYHTQIKSLDDDRCGSCGADLNIIFK